MCVPWPNKAVGTSWPKWPSTSWIGGVEGNIFPVMEEITYMPKNLKAQQQLEFRNVTVVLRSESVTTFIRFLSA